MTQALNKAAILQQRREHFGRNCSISYQDPLLIIRGEGQYLYDEQGHQYLDCVNNVCHVGHSHPRVVKAIADQAAILNTNTRYLHPLLVEYCDRLLEKFPDPLSVVYLVCSGSEAVDLALRLAYAHTGSRETLCLAGAYHGHTEALIGISPYKFDRGGGEGAPASTRVIAAPDAYRGPFKGPGCGPDYAELVARGVDTLLDDGQKPAAFIAEGAMGCGGQIILPDNYLQPAFAAVRAAAGLCIVDEVQCGFGRPGESFWAYESQAVVPDIVTLGKPIGNGHPMAAVVTTPEVADSFNNGMEFFATFGGNPVSCAAGLAVLDVIEEQQLQSHAKSVGDQLLSMLGELKTRHALIGDVRGRGLFIGVELVRDHQRLDAADQEATQVINAMRHKGILLSTDGPLDNVLKIKPPMVFSHKDAVHLVETLDQVLGDVEKTL